jgi:uncharacterized damage-inducible protein DinB
MDINTFKLLVKYNREVNRQMDNIIKTLSEEEWNKQFSGYFKSIHELCSHIFISDYKVIRRFKAVKNFKSLDDAYFNKEYKSGEILFKNIDEYLTKRPELDNIFINFINEITTAELDKEVKWKDAKGVEIKKKVEIMLMHLFAHEIHHRGMISLYWELIGKVKVGSKEIKKYDAPRSPYQRLLESEALSPEVKAELTRLCGLYNPVQLQPHVNKTVLALREAVVAQSSSSEREPAA